MSTEQRGKTDGNEPVNGSHTTFGLTKRELFAAMAMQGMLAASDDRYEKTSGISNGESIALGAVIQADFLIEALNKETKE